MTRICLLVVLAAALLAGCPRSRDGGGSGGDIPIESLDSEVARAYCDLLFRCGIADDDVIALKLLFRDSATCVGYLERSLFGSGEQAALMRAVADGTVAYDGAAARRCADSVRTGCSAAVSGADIGDSADCDAVFVGTVAEGGTCWLDEECSGELGCDFGAGTCPGTCTAGGVGFPCGAATEGCAAGEECFFAETGERCVTELFQSDGIEGDPCGLVSETGSTVTRRGCAPGLWCTGDSYTMGTCRTPIASGAPCAGNDDVCVEGHVCAGGSCVEVTIARSAGAPCGETVRAVCDPLARLECVSGTCATFTDGAAGSPCRTGDFGEITCNEGLVCHSDTETCGAPRPAGATCGSSGECASGDCDFSTNTCRERYCDA